MMTRAVEGKQRLIPVLLADADMPPLLASRVWIDFRNADGPVYEARVRALVMALKGERPGPPPRIEPPPGLMKMGGRKEEMSVLIRGIFVPMYEAESEGSRDRGMGRGEFL